MIFFTLKKASYRIAWNSIINSLQTYTQTRHTKKKVMSEDYFPKELKDKWKSLKTLDNESFNNSLPWVYTV